MQFPPPYVNLLLFILIENIVEYKNTSVFVYTVANHGVLLCLFYLVTLMKAL
jgi:hypothetical protein